MPHFRIDPMKELEFLTERMKKFVEEFPESFSFEFGKAFEPRVDVFQTDNDVLIFAELPGMKKEEINISLKDDILRLSGEKKRPVEDPSITQTRAERSFGAFDRKIQLPSEVNPENIKASIIDGVLEITLQKLQPEKEKEIAIDIQ